MQFAPPRGRPGLQYEYNNVDIINRVRHSLLRMAFLAAALGMGLATGRGELADAPSVRACDLCEGGQQLTWDAIAPLYSSTFCS